MQPAGACEASAAVRPSQGVIIQSVPEIPIDAYLVALSRVLDPRSVTHIARTGEGVCVFLDSVSEAEDLAEDGVVEVDGVALACRPYRADSRRVRLSECPPFLRDCDIVAELRKFGQVFPPLVAEPVSTAVPDFAHVLSFTKTVAMVLKGDLRDVLSVPYEGLQVPVRLTVEAKTAWLESSWPPQRAADASPRDSLAAAATTSGKVSSRGPRQRGCRSFRSPVDAFMARHPTLALMARASPAASPSASRSSLQRGASPASTASPSSRKRRASPTSMAASDSASTTSCAVAARTAGTASTPRGLRGVSSVLSAGTASTARPCAALPAPFMQHRSPYDPGGGRRAAAVTPRAAVNAVKRFIA